MAVGAVATLGDVLLDVVESDNPTHSYKVTEMAVEEGTNVSDHMKAQPAVLSITGIVVGEDASTRLERIKKYQSDRELVTYINRVIYHNMAVESIATSHSRDIANGFSFDIQMKQVRIASSKEIQITNVPPAVATKAKTMTSAGTKQTKKTGKELSQEIREFGAATNSEGDG